MASMPGFACANMHIQAVFEEGHSNYYHKQHYEHLVDVSETRADPISNTFGSVRGGHIKLTGPLCHGHLHVTSFNAHSEPSFSVVLSSTGHNIKISHAYLDVGRPGLTQASVSGTVCVLAGLFKCHFISAVPMHGLVLRATGNKDGQYTRIGTFDIDDWKPRSHDEEIAFGRLLSCFGGDLSAADPGQINDYMRLEDAFEAFDLPPDSTQSISMRLSDGVNQADKHGVRSPCQ